MNFIFFVAVLISTISGMATGMCFKRDSRIKWMLRVSQNLAKKNLIILGPKIRNHTWPKKSQTIPCQKIPNQTWPNNSKPYLAKISKTIIRLKSEKFQKFSFEPKFADIFGEIWYFGGNFLARKRQQRSLLYFLLKILKIIYE